MCSVLPARSVSSADALRSTRALADVLSKDANPKMRNSQFLQFVSKMSRGELMFEDNKVRVCTWSI
jgi:peroxin-5